MSEKPNRITLTARALTKLKREFPDYIIEPKGMGITAVCKFCRHELRVDDFSVGAVQYLRNRIKSHNKNNRHKKKN